MKFDKLDEVLLAGAETEVPFYRAASGFTMLKKMAEEGVPDSSPIPGPATALVPTDMVCGLMSQLVSLKFAKQQAYITYGTLMQSIAQDANLSDWAGHAETEQNHAKFFLRRLNTLKGEGFEIPPTPPVPTLKDPDAIVRQLMSFEEQAIALMGQLRTMLQDGDPTRFQVEQQMTEDQYHLDQLKTRTSVPLGAAKMAMLVKKARLLKVAGPGEPLVIPPPNDDSPEEYVGRERSLQMDQMVQELAHTKMQLNQTTMAAQQAQQEGMQAQQELEEVGVQIEDAQAQAEQANQMSQAHQQQSVDAEGRAAEHATQKMQLGMRVQQMRQALAEIATQDPVTETASNASDLAAQGAPATPDQIQQEEAAAQEAEAGAEEGAPPEAAEEQEEAARAQEEADVQGAQADNASAGGPATASGGAPGGPAAAPAGPAEMNAGMGAA